MYLFGKCAIIFARGIFHWYQCDNFFLRPCMDTNIARIEDLEKRKKAWEKTCDTERKRRVEKISLIDWS